MPIYKPLTVVFSVVCSHLTGVAWTAAAGAGEAVAIVEDVRAGSTTLEIMDYVEAGQVIRLQAGESLVLGYFASCWRERITGGTITVGPQESRVDGGEVKRVRVECDSSRLLLDNSQSASGGVLVLRDPNAVDPANLPKPDRTLHGTHPVIRLSTAGGTVTFQRLDEKGERFTVPVPGDRLDMARTKFKLSAGGLYFVQAGERSLIVKVDPYAHVGDGPKLNRLLQF